MGLQFTLSVSMKKKLYEETGVIIKTMPTGLELQKAFNDNNEGGPNIAACLLYTGA